ncbi:hypothetical protein [Bradyrhizobium sp. CB1015]|uniref:hypothetical protein n=1 Tax=Bradyrhizobium sp. CB1015 TaxID=2976822 RepID=UPI0021AA6BE5|nr:hypothetical protein [Bradyrhizobium sp. CB1015]UWU90163.1 hypothetical protein N2604_27255 [Bradyrhizobium sp. CB1015]
MSGDPEDIQARLGAERIALVHAAGECLMAWASFEFYLHEMFVSEVILDSKNPQRYVLARGVWSVVVSFEARLKLVDVAIKSNIRDEQVLRDWKLLRSHILRISALRNEIAHGAAVNFDNRQMMIQPYLTVINSKAKPLDHAEIVNRRLSFIETQAGIDWLSLCISALRRPDVREHFADRVQAPPDLVVRLRVQAERSRGKIREASDAKAGNTGSP